MTRDRRSKAPRLAAGRGIREGVIVIPRGPRSLNPVSPLASVAPRLSPPSPEPPTGPGPTQRRRIYCVDVGSTRQKPSRFAWTRIDPDEDSPTPAGNCSIKSLCRNLVDDLKAGRSVALGFEAPLFIPVPTCADELSTGRENEGDRSCFAPAGGYVATLGLHQAAYILKCVAAQLGELVRFTVDPIAWPPRGDAAVLFCWEALVTGDAHAAKTDPQPHLRDAATAAMEFRKQENRLACLPNAITAERPLSLIGAAAVWSGLVKDRDLIRESTVVVRARAPFDGEIKEVDG